MKIRYKLIGGSSEAIITLRDIPCEYELDARSDHVASWSKIIEKKNTYNDIKFIYFNERCVGVITGKSEEPGKINHKISEYLTDGKISNLRYLLDVLKGPIYQIKQVFIDYRHQKKGIGSTAIKQFIDFLKSKYHNLTEVQIATNNIDALRLYVKLGFVKLYDTDVIGDVYVHLIKQLEYQPKLPIFHIAGTQGSGKTTLGSKLKEKYGDGINLLELDDLAGLFESLRYSESTTVESESEQISYQEFLTSKIKEASSEKPLIITGLDAILCLGEMEDSDIVYELYATYKFYIRSSTETVRQRFYRQIDKLEKRKEQFFSEWIKGGKEAEKIQAKIFRYVDLNKWHENNSKCDSLYRTRGYLLMTADQILGIIDSILQRS